MPEFNNERTSPVELSPDDFRKAGYKVVDRIASFLDSLPSKPVSPEITRDELQKIIGIQSMPNKGESTEKILEQAADLLFKYTTFNGHPKFWGYITSSAAPIGALGDLLAASVNPNVGAWNLSPVATEIEAQTIRWIAEMIGYRTDCGGLMVSGGNMANFIGFLTARKAKAKWDIRKEGLAGSKAHSLLVYASKETHTWIQKAVDLFGLGTDSIRWISVDEKQKILIDELESKIKADKENGQHPFMVVGNAGTVSTGAIDPLNKMYEICKENDLWLHVDGAYGAFAAAIPDAPDDLKALKFADSIALDPHKWLYVPLEAGCILVQNPSFLIDAFSYHPAYYNFITEEEGSSINYYEFGFQNSRGFRALKVWLSLKQAGVDGYKKMIADDINLSKHLYKILDSNPNLEVLSQSLSITTFRFIPPDIDANSNKVSSYLNDLNEKLLHQLNEGGEAFVSNAVIEEKFVLRACIVNFRTTIEDIEMLPELVTEIGIEIDSKIRPVDLKSNK